MNLLTAFSTALTTFTVTTLDDLLLLILCFSQMKLHRRQVVLGQYLGFGLLVLASLSGFLGGLVWPRAWLGLLGILPISLGLNRLFQPPESDQEEFSQIQAAAMTPKGSFLSPQLYTVAALTIANGGDNLGVYVPLFAQCTWETLALILALFFSLVGVWCYAAYQLIRLPAFADTLMRYGNPFVPYVLIGLGAGILWDSQTVADRGLRVIASLIGLGYLLNPSRTSPVSSAPPSAPPSTALSTTPTPPSLSEAEN